jgi:hypothetical protein
MNRLSLALAAATAVSGLSFTAAHAATNAPMQNPVRLSSAEKSVAESPAAANAIRLTIADLANDALTPKGMDYLVHRFTEADQKRIKASATYDQNFGSALDNRIDQISKDWKQKYGHDFNIENADKAFGTEFASIHEGVAGSNPELASSVTENGAKGHEKLAADQKIALATITGMHGMAAVKVPMIYEAGDWRVNLPATEDASVLRHNLLDHLTRVSDQSARWPSDENAAYRHVTHAVLLAVLDQSPASRTKTAK